MINGLGVLGWGVGGIEAEAVMLGQPVYMLIRPTSSASSSAASSAPACHGDRPGAAPSCEMLREPGRGRQVRRVLRRRHRRDAARRTGRRSPTWRPSTAPPAASSPIDERDARAYMRLSNRATRHVAQRREAYCEGPRALRETADTPDPEFTDTLGLDLATVEPAPSPAPSARRIASAWLGHAKHFAEVDHWPSSRLCRPRLGKANARQHRQVEGIARLRPSATATSSSRRSPPAPTRRTRGHARRRPRWPSNAAGQGPQRQALGEDLAGAGLEASSPSTTRRPTCTRRPRGARLQRRRLRLHDLHRQLGPAAARRSSRRRSRTRPIWWSPRCSPATATSRAASTDRPPTSWRPAAGRRLRHRRHHSTSTSTPSRSARTTTATTSS